MIHEDGHAVYHLAGGRDGGPGDDRKIGVHDGGAVTAAADRDGVVDAAARERSRRLRAALAAGARPDAARRDTCLYTDDAVEDFLARPVGDAGGLLACSGHGAKFAPLIGEYVADLVTGAGVPPERFRLRRAPAPAGPAASRCSGRSTA